MCVYVCVQGLTCWIHLLGQLQGIRVCQVRVCRSDSQDEAVLTGDELHEHVFDLELNVGGLVPHRHLGHARQVHQGQVEDCKGYEVRRGCGEEGVWEEGVWEEGVWEEGAGEGNKPLNFETVGLVLYNISRLSVTNGGLACTTQKHCATPTRPESQHGLGQSITLRSSEVFLTQYSRNASERATYGPL